MVWTKVCDFLWEWCPGPNFGPPKVVHDLRETTGPTMSHYEPNEFTSGTAAPKTRKSLPVGLIVAGVVVLIAIGAVLMAFPGGGDHRTPHAPINAAMGGSPSESDHTNTDADDQVGGFGKGDQQGVVADDNVQRTQGSPMPVPAAKDTTSAK